MHPRQGLKRLLLITTFTVIGEDMVKRGGDAAEVTSITKPGAGNSRIPATGAISNARRRQPDPGRTGMNLGAVVSSALSSPNGVLA